MLEQQEQMHSQVLSTHFEITLHRYLGFKSTLIDLSLRESDQYDFFDTDSHP